MNSDKYNYTLNGIEHQIDLNNNQIKISSEPFNDKILISNKFILKYINDLFDFHNIEYFITSHTLLGFHVFNGINLFEKDNYICIFDHHYNKLKKIKDDIIKDNFYYEEKTFKDNGHIESEFNEENPNFIKINGSFFDKIIVNCYIFILKSDDNKILNHRSFNENTCYQATASADIHKANSALCLGATTKRKIIDYIEFEFYDIYPLKQIEFEEFKMFVPNKINNVLIKYNYNLNNIVLKKNNMMDDLVTTTTCESIKSQFTKNKSSNKDMNRIKPIDKNIFEEELSFTNEYNNYNTSIFGKIFNKLF